MRRNNNAGLSAAAAKGFVATLVAEAQKTGAAPVKLKAGGKVGLPAIVEAGRKAGLTFVQTGDLEGYLCVDHRPVAG